MDFSGRYGERGNSLVKAFVMAYPTLVLGFSRDATAPRVPCRERGADQLGFPALTRKNKGCGTRPMVKKLKVDRLQQPHVDQAGLPKTRPALGLATCGPQCLAPFHEASPHL